MAVGGGVEHLGWVGEQAARDIHLRHHPLQHAEVAEIGLKSGHQIELLLFARLPGVVSGKGLREPFEHIVPAGDMAADKAGGMGVRNGDAVVNKSLFFGVGDKRLQIVADHLGHAGGGDGDNLGFIQRAGILQAQIHVVVAAEHRRVLGHGVGDAGHRLFKMAVKVGAKIGDAALGAVDVGQGTGEPQRAEYGAERLAGFGRVDGQRLALEVQRFILGGGGPGKNLLHTLRVVRLFKGLFILEQGLVFILFKQRITAVNFIDRLAHGVLLPRHKSVD